MSIRLIIEGNAVYEIDEDCRKCGHNHEKEIVTTEVGKSKEKDGKKQETQKNAVIIPPLPKQL